MRAREKVNALLGRRALLVGVSALVGASRASVACAGEPVDVLVVGDSMIVGTLGRSLRDRLRAVGFSAERFAKTSSGLSRPDFYDWIARASDLVETHTPRACMVMFGGNDGQGLAIARPDHCRSPEAKALCERGAKWIRWGEPAWETEYRARVRALAEVLPIVFWIGMPVMGRKGLNARVRAINAMVVAELQSVPAAHFVDVWAVLADADGEFTDSLRVDGKRTRLRAGDGVHLTIAGAERLAEHVIARALAPLVFSAALPAAR